MKLILLSHPKTVDNEVDIINTMFDEGMSHFHIRKPNHSTSQLSEFISEIRSKYRHKLTIHSHHELAIKYQLQGIHLTRSHKRRIIRTWLKTELLKYQRPELKVSTSFHKLSALYKNTYLKRFDYVFLSPVFGSISKRGYEAGFIDAQIKAALIKTDYRVIALVGIEVDKMEHVKNLGFHGMAFLGAIWNSDDPLDVFRKVKENYKLLGMSERGNNDQSQ